MAWGALLHWTKVPGLAFCEDASEQPGRPSPGSITSRHGWAGSPGHTRRASSLELLISTRSVKANSSTFGRYCCAMGFGYGGPRYPRLQGATRIVFERAPWGTVAMYACAAAWVWDRQRRGLIRPEEIEAIIVREGGVAALAKVYRREHGSGRAAPKPSRAIYETTLASIPRAGFILGDTAKQLPEHDLLAVVRRDARGRRYVVPLDLAESRVRELVVRVTRNARRTLKATKTG